LNKIDISSAAKKDLKKIDRVVSLKILKEVFPLLEKNPSAGKELTGALCGLRSYQLIAKGIHYRIIYEYGDEIIGIIKVSSRENIYKKIKRRLKK